MWIAVRGSSMAPLLRSGMRVLVRPVAFAALRVGDVVLIAAGQIYLCHRVVARDDGHVTTRGDTLAHVEGPFAQQQVVGRVELLQDGDRLQPLDTPGLGLYGALHARLVTPLLRLPGADLAFVGLKRACYPCWRAVRLLAGRR